MAAAAEKLLRAAVGEDHEVLALPDGSAAQENPRSVDGAHVIVGGPVTQQIAERARDLKLFHVFRGGTDGLGIEHLPLSVTIANTYHHEKSVADFVLLAMLVLVRKGCERDRQLRNGNWNGSAWWSAPPEVDALDGKTVLIVGLGHIGSEVARRTRAFGMNLHALSRTPERLTAVVDRAVSYEALHDELSEADFVVASCRLAPNTEGLFGKQEFERMKRSAYFINVARGGVVDEEALYQALRGTRIAGAAIDVWWRFPSSRDETCFPSRLPFHELPNVLLSPHCSSWTRHMLEARVRDVAENVRRLVQGRPLINVVRQGDE